MFWNSGFFARRLQGGLFVIVLLLCCLMPGSTQAEEEGFVLAKGLAWPTFEAAFKHAKAENKFVLMKLYAPWCHYCRKMQKEVFSQPQIQSQLKKDFVLTLLNLEGEKQVKFRGEIYQEEQLAIMMGLYMTPTVVFFRADGKPVGGWPGYQDAQTFSQLLQFVASKSYESMTFDAYQKQ